MIIDGRAIAADILAACRADMQHRGTTPVVRAIVVRPSPATESYLKIKQANAESAGMRMEVVRLSETATTETVTDAVTAPGADAIIVQLPLPAHIDSQVVLDAIPVEADADVLSSTAFARFADNEPGALVPPVAAAVATILEHASVQLPGRRAVVIGRGQLVGRPVARMLERAGAHVTVIDRESNDPAAVLWTADIVVSGAGVPKLVTPDMVAPGVVLIDAGTSDASGTIAGDMDPACAEHASVFTPVPGGVGPVAVACLFQNVERLLSKKQTA